MRRFIFSILILSVSEMSNLRFLTDGHERALQGLKSMLAAIRLKIKEEIKAEFASQLSTAGYLKQLALHLQMERELRRRYAQAVSEIISKAPPDALYLKR
jgi:hypothetical protein